jgi:geranylgeranyl pyrophosphate synthase
MEQCTPAEARLIETVLGEQEFKTVSQKEILSIVEKYQTVEKARSLARRFAAEAHSSLQLFPKSPFKDALEAIPQFILDREK